MRRALAVLLDRACAITGHGGGAYWWHKFVCSTIGTLTDDLP